MNLFIGSPTPIEPSLDDAQRLYIDHEKPNQNTGSSNKGKQSFRNQTSAPILSVPFPDFNRTEIKKLNYQAKRKQISKLAPGCDRSKYRERMGNFSVLNKETSIEEKDKIRKNLSTTSRNTKKLNTVSMLLSFKNKFGQGSSGSIPTDKSQFLLSDFEGIYNFSNIKSASFSSLRAIDNVGAVRSYPTILNDIGNLSIRSMNADGFGSIDQYSNEIPTFPHFNSNTSIVSYEHERATLTSAASDDRTANIIYGDDVNDSDSIQEGLTTLAPPDDRWNLVSESSVSHTTHNEHFYPPYYPYYDLSERESSAITPDTQTHWFITEPPISESEESQDIPSRASEHQHESSLTAFINSVFPMSYPYSGFTNTLTMNSSENLLRFSPMSSIQHSFNSINDSLRSLHSINDTFNGSTPMTTASPELVFGKFPIINNTSFVSPHDNPYLKNPLYYGTSFSDPAEGQTVSKIESIGNKVRDSRFSRRLVNLFKSSKKPI